jgi:glutathione S-transferase
MHMQPSIREQEGDMPLTFYYGSGSPFSWKVWLALEHKRIAYEQKILSFQARDPMKPEYLAINPRHQVPAIVDGDLTLYESAAIVEYLEDKYRESGEPLWPEELRARAYARRVAVEADLYVTAAIGKLTALFFRGDGTPDAAALDAARRAITEELALIERAILGPFVAGARVSAADFALYPHLAFLPRIDARRPGYDALALAPERIREWMTRMQALPYLAKTFPPHWRQ